MDNTFFGVRGRARRKKRGQTAPPAASIDSFAALANPTGSQPSPLDAPTVPDKPLFNTDQAEKLTMLLALNERYAILSDRLKRDLLQLVKRENNQPVLNLMEMLHLERGRYPQKQEYLVQLLCDDVTIFVREKMITAIKLLFFDVAPQDGQYVVRLQVEYPYTLINQDHTDEGKPQAPLPDPVTQARAWLDPELYHLAIVAQWWPAIARDKIIQIRRHLYFFDWVASEKFLALAAPATPDRPDDAQKVADRQITMLPDFEGTQEI